MNALLNIVLAMGAAVVILVLVGLMLNDRCHCERCQDERAQQSTAPGPDSPDAA